MSMLVVGIPFLMGFFNNKQWNTYKTCYQYLQLLGKTFSMVIICYVSFQLDTLVISHIGVSHNIGIWMLGS